MTFLIRSVKCLFNISKNNLFAGLMRYSVPTESLKMIFLFENEIALP